MRFTFSVVGVALALTACSGSPSVTQSGPRPTVKLAGAWKLGNSPGREARFSPNGKWLAASTAAGDVTIRSSGDWRLQRRFKHPGGATALTFTPDGEHLFTTGYDGRVRAWSLQTGGQEWEAQLSNAPIWTIDVSAGGRLLAVAGEDKAIRLVPLGQAKPQVRVLRGHERNIWEVRFRPRTASLASGSFDETARIWSLNGAPLKLLRGHTEAVVGLDFSPDGSVLATGGDDSTVRLWDPDRGAAMRTIDAGNHVYKLEFSPDGRWLAGGGRARGAIGTFWYQLTGRGAAATPVRLWRVRDGALVAALPHTTDIFAITYSPDGRHVATADNDGVLRVWQIN